jgi:hypothetical protein
MSKTRWCQREIVCQQTLASTCTEERRLSHRPHNNIKLGMIDDPTDFLDLKPMPISRTLHP